MIGLNKHSILAWQWLVFIAFSIVITSSVVSAQSLAEIAKKEKERRAQADREGEGRVITERDLRTGYGTMSASTPTTPAARSTGGAGEAGAGAAPVVVGEDEEDETKTREYWQERVTAANKKIQDLEARLQSDETNWGGGMRTDVNPIGQKNLSQRQGIESQLEEAKAELQAIQAEGRRAGVPKGWLR